MTIEEMRKNIPEELKRLPQWVTRKGKVPYTPGTDTQAKAGIPETWGKFDEAIRAYQCGGFDGIGFEFTDNGGIVGIDLDHVVDKDTNEVKGWALDIISKLHSYTEYSISGTGLHIFVYGRIPKDGRKKVINKETGEAIEMYQAKRYFTVSGNPAYNIPISDRSAELTELYQEFFPEQGQITSASILPQDAPNYLQKGLNKDNRLAALWNGQRDTTDESSNDLALLNKLAYWCNKDERMMIDAFMRSPYVSQKDSAHKKKLMRDDYLHRTAQIAINGCMNTAAGDNKVFHEKVKNDNQFESNHKKRLTIETAKNALQELGITIRYNLLLKEPEVSGLPECYSSENAVNVLPIYLMDYLKTCGYQGVSQQTVDGCLNCISDQNRYNPIEELLYSIKWDKADRLQEIYQILGVTESKYQTYIKKWLIQCVALGLNDEKSPIGAEGVLVLQGEQGLAKTSFFRMLSPFPRWFVEGAIIDLKDKDTVIKALSGWLAELGELDGILKREQSSFKAFITSPEDRIRPPYARNHTRTPRRTSFCGTVNPQDYLRDETGSRRFWTIPIEHIDKQKLFSLSHEWVTQLWAQIYVMYRQNKNGFRLTSEEMKALQSDNQEFSIPLDYETEIREMLDFDLPIEQWEWWKASDIADKIGYKVDARKVGKVLVKVEKELKNVIHFNTLDTLKTKRIHDGITEYFIPLKRFIKYKVGKVV